MGGLQTIPFLKKNSASIFWYDKGRKIELSRLTIDWMYWIYFLISSAVLVAAPQWVYLWRVATNLKPVNKLKLKIPCVPSDDVIYNLAGAANLNKNHEKSHWVLFEYSIWKNSFSTFTTDSACSVTGWYNCISRFWINMTCDNQNSQNGFILEPFSKTVPLCHFFLNNHV